MVKYPRAKLALIVSLLTLTLFLPGCSYLTGISVESYIKQVESIKQTADQSLLNLNASLSVLSEDLEQVKATLEELKSGKEAIVRAREEIENLENPEEAQVLKDDLLDLYLKGEDLLAELIATGEYRLVAEPITEEYEQQAKRFAEAVSQTKNNEELIGSLTGYKEAAAAAQVKLRTLKPPLLSSHGHERFLTNLSALEDGLGATIAAIEQNDAASLEAASKKLSEVSGSNTELKEIMKAERESDTRAFNAIIVEISKLAEKVRLDVVELKQKLQRK